MRRITAHARAKGSSPAHSLRSDAAIAKRQSQPSSSEAYFRLEEGLSAVKFRPVEFFEDSFPSIGCLQDLREWLLVFLADDRRGLDKEVLPELQRRGQELTFLVRGLCTKFKVGVQVPLRAMLLRHGNRGSMQAAEAAANDVSSAGPVLAAFLARFQEMTDSNTKQDKLQHVVDFDDGEQLCKCITRKVRELLTQDKATREESAHS